MMKNRAVSLGLFLVFSLLIRPVQAETLIILNKSGASASLIDLSSGKTVATLSTGKGPHEVAVSPDGKKALIANYGEHEAGNSLTLIDIPKASVLQTIDLGKYRRPHGIQWFAGGKKVLVTVEAQRAVLLLRLEPKLSIEEISTQQNLSHMVVVNSSATRAFVSNIGSGSITALDLERKQHVAHVSTGLGAEGIDLSPDGRQLWVTNREANTISVIDTEKLSVIQTIHGGGEFPIRIKITPDGKYALATNARSGNLSVYDTKELKEIRRIDFEEDPEHVSTPIGILIHPNGKTAYIALSNAQRVSAMDLETWKITHSFETGKEPDGLGYSPVSVQNAALEAGGEKEKGSRP